jgi:hypothetical protein
MRLGSILKWVASAALVTAVAGSATAQAPGGGAGGGAGAGASTDAQVGFERKQALSPQEELTQADVMISRMEQAANVVRRQLEQARAQRDVVKTLCLNDKLSQIDVAVRSARDRKTALQAAVTRNDVELSNHEFTIMTVLRQRAEQLTAEANQCLGEEVAFIGQTQVITQVDPTLPGDDDTQYPPTDPTLINAPPVALSSTGQ